MISQFRKTKMDNGVTLVTESHPYQQSVSVGFFENTGSRDESQKLMGISHFLEHMVFKGTKSRSTFEIAKSLEAVGGDLNAYTTKEYTCYHALALKEHLPLCLDVLYDLTENALLGAEDTKTERGVIEQEIDMGKESVEEYIFDMFFELAYAKHPLGYPILGTKSSLKKMTSKDLREYYQSRYGGKNQVISVTGAVDHDEILKLLSKLKNKKEKPPVKRVDAKRKAPRWKPFREFEHRDSEQVHLLMGFPSCSFKDSTRFDSYIADSLLGGGMTSRLYQKIREDKGLAYSVYSQLQSFNDCGMLMIYAGTAPENAEQALKIIRKEMEKLVKEGISSSLVKFFKTQVKGNILLGSDDMENRMNSLGINEMVYGRYRPVKEIIDEIDKVSVKSVNDYIEKYWHWSKSSLLVMGPCEPKQALDILNV